jgi:hypothetical protein
MTRNNYVKNTTVIAFSDSKSACLFFDNVIPIEIGELIPHRGSGEKDTFEILPAILPNSLIDASAPRGLHPGILKYVARYIFTFPASMGITNLPCMTLEERKNSMLPELISSLSNLIDSVGEPIHGLLGRDPSSNSPDCDTDPSLILSSLNLVDTSSLSWSHLLEFRKDEDSKRKLRNLRLLIYDEFQGKPKRYIEDKLLIRIEQYNETVKKWGMKTLESALKITFSSKSVAALGASAIATGLGAGLPLAAMIGVVLEIGGVTLEIAKSRRDLNEFKSHDPVSYIIEARNIAINDRG